MYGLVAPLVIGNLASYCGKRVAKQQPTPYESIRAYHATRKLVGMVAIVVAILYAIYETSQEERVFDHGLGAYGVLNIDARASYKQISQGYRKRALSCHPDKNPDASNEYELVNKAYDVLKGPNQKFVYDRFGSGGLEQYQRFGDKGYSLICSNYILSSLYFWLFSIFSSLINLFLGADGIKLQLLTMAILGTSELLLISREWYAWYLPLPIFQCVRILRTSLPIVMGSIPLLFHPVNSPFKAEAERLNQALTQSKILADKRLDLITDPFKSDELTMKRFQYAANAALE